jgi:hypothetical protein
MSLVPANPMALHIEVQFKNDCRLVAILMLMEGILRFAAGSLLQVKDMK